MRMKEEDLLEDISGFLHGYLKSGKVNINSFLSKTNINITNLEQLLRVRFLLMEMTKEFVEGLPNSLRRFRTSTRLKNETHYGEVRGQIDWGQTIVERLATNYKDQTLFSTSESHRSYDTPENLVLKELVGILYYLLYQDAYLKGFEDREWFKDWKRLKENIAYAFKKNIYLSRVSLTYVSERIIQKTLTHRSKMYRNAAELLLFYRKLTNGNFSEEDLNKILSETLITPDNKDVLFELYWVVQIIKKNAKECELYLLDGSQNLFASWKDPAFIYRLYHDSVGSGNIQFNVAASEVAESENTYLQHKYQSFQLSKQVVQEVFGRSSSSQFWGGRPDFLLEVYQVETNELAKVVIGEVKNTTHINYGITGLRELMDYIHLAKDSKGSYLLGGEVEVQGMLCVQNIEMGQSGDSDLIRVVTSEEHVKF